MTNRPEPHTRHSPVRGGILLVLGLLAATLTLPDRAAAYQHFPPAEDLELMARYVVEDGETPGIVLGVLEADGTSRIVHWGDAGPEAQPLGPKSAFEIGSITKVFTGILLADLVERGDVALSDPVAKHLPPGVSVPTWEGEEITLLDLATHRSSLPRMPSNMVREGADYYPSYTIDDLYDFLSGHELRRPIGSEFEYSNIGVALLGHVLERASGKSYESLLRDRILDPLGMEGTSTRVEGPVRWWMTRGHGEYGDVAPYRNWPNLPAMGALRSNAEDLLVFLAANIGAPETRLERVMRVAQRPRAERDPANRVGLNWMIREDGGRRILNHGGGTAGYSTLIAFDPDREIGVVLLTNTRSFDDDIGLGFLRDGPPLDLPQVRVERDTLGHYVGVYELGPDDVLVVRLEPEGWLTIQRTGEVRYRLYATSDSTFYARREPWQVRFRRGAGGAVELIADLDGAEVRAARTGVELPSIGVVAENPAYDLPLDPGAMARYEGTYGLRVGTGTRDLVVSVRDGRLHASLPGQDPVRMLHLGSHEFRLAARADVLMTFTVENGRAEAVSVRQYGGVFRGTRAPR